MRVIDVSQVTPQPVTEEGAKGTTIRWLLGKPEQAPNFAMRLFELEPGGATPLHEHAWEHEVYVLDGSLQVVVEQGPVEVSADAAVLVMPGERHQFRNVGNTVGRMLCVIPLPEQS
jgi:quercetin dioxygenase-like cupin family protein